MNKYLIFRTDRIGDFLVCAILLKCIKKNDPLSNITLIASEKNYSYIKNFPYVDHVIKLENKFFNKISLVYKLRKSNFKNVIIHDNKKRSKIISLFLKSEKKIIFKRSNQFSHFEIIQIILKKMNFIFFKDSLDIFSHKKNNYNEEEIIQLHFDEKWIHNDYIKNFVNIEPSKDELFNLIKKITLKTKKKLIITSGYNMPRILKENLSKINNLKIKVYNNLSLTELEEITSKSKILIACHGAISHIAAGHNIKQIDIIDRSYNYNRWNYHFRNYNFLYREKIKILTDNILEKL